MTTDWKKQGRTNRRKGGEFERKVREWLRDEDWVVDKFSSNVDLEEGEFVTAKPKFNAFRKAMGIGTGFPDFVCWRPRVEGEGYELMFVECKVSGELSRLEKLKMAWLEGEGYCCWVANKNEHAEIRRGCINDIELKKPKKAKEIKKAVEDGI